MLILICKLSFIIRRDGHERESENANIVSAASWITSHAIGRHLEGIIKEVFPNFGPKLPKMLERTETVQVSELLAAMVKGFERGYRREKVLHFYSWIK